MSAEPDRAAQKPDLSKWVCLPQAHASENQLLTRS